MFTESEVQDEVRLTEFLNQQPLDLGPEQRRAAAERLVDQQLIRNEMQIGGYPQPSQSEAEAMLRNFRQEHYRSIRSSGRRSKSMASARTSSSNTCFGN